MGDDMVFFLISMSILSAVSVIVVLTTKRVFEISIKYQIERDSSVPISIVMELNDRTQIEIARWIIMVELQGEILGYSEKNLTSDPNSGIAITVECMIPDDEYVSAYERVKALIKCLGSKLQINSILFSNLRVEA